MLTRGAAAEVPAGDEDRVDGQLEVRLLAPVVEQKLAESGALNALEELLGDDLVGVDVAAVEDGDSLAEKVAPRDVVQIESGLSLFGNIIILLLTETGKLV